MVLKRHSSVVAQIPLSADGHLLRDSSTGEFEYIHADQLEVSPDGKWFYYQPGSGNMSRIETKYLHKAQHDSSFVEKVPEHVEPFPRNSKYWRNCHRLQWHDGDRQEIRILAPDGGNTLLVRDRRLLWIDAMWLDHQQRLWMCASQLNHGDRFVQPGNKSITIHKPIYVYTIDVGESPSALDHA
ncbi:unnamed protein product [Penicillium pancosmium]